MLALTAPYVRLIGAFHEGGSQDEVAVRALRLASSQLLRGRAVAHRHAARKTVLARER